MCSLGCNSESDKLVQAEFDKIQGTWQIASFNTNISTNDSLKNILKKGEVLFNNCKYNRKSFDKNEVCSGDFQVNEIIYNLSYLYSSTSKLFSLKLFPSGPSGQSMIVLPGTEQYNVRQLMNGEWEFILVNNTLSAKQIKNTALPNIQVSFTATRK
jgi:hypothetical protein